MIGGEQNGFVSGDGGHAGKTVHALRSSDARNGVQAETGDAALSQLLRQLGVSQRRQETNDRFAFRNRGL